jgi:uncharacterized membrane protein YagU involved in acid resistance
MAISLIFHQRRRRFLLGQIKTFWPRSPRRGLMNLFLTGAIAGFIATIPMTALMEALHSKLPEEEKYPLPPKEIAMELAEKAGVEEELNEPQLTGLTLFSHFLYGTAAGALYAPLSRIVPIHSAFGGATYGLAVWAGSYLKLIPELGILRPATEHPARRNALMIAAHLLWGASLGLSVDLMDRD